MMMMLPNRPRKKTHRQSLSDAVRLWVESFLGKKGRVDARHSAGIKERGEGKGNESTKRRRRDDDTSSSSSSSFSYREDHHKDKFSSVCSHRLLYFRKRRRRRRKGGPTRLCCVRSLCKLPFTPPTVSLFSVVHKRGGVCLSPFSSTLMCCAALCYAKVVVARCFFFFFFFFHQLNFWIEKRRRRRRRRRRRGLCWLWLNDDSICIAADRKEKVFFSPSDSSLLRACDCITQPWVWGGKEGGVKEHCPD